MKYNLLQSLQSCTLSPNCCFCFTLQNLFIQLSCIFGGTWWNNLEISWVKCCYFSSTVSLSSLKIRLLSKRLFTWYRDEFCSRMSSFQNEVCTAFTWQNRPAQPEAFSPCWNDTHVLLAPVYTVCGFHLGRKFVFSLHDTRMKCHTRTRISLGLKTGMNSFRKELYGNKISSQYDVNRYGEIYGDKNELVAKWKSFRYHVNSP